MDNDMKCQIVAMFHQGKTPHDIIAAFKDRLTEADRGHDGFISKAGLTVRAAMSLKTNGGYPWRIKAFMPDYNDLLKDIGYEGERVF